MDHVLSTEPFRCWYAKANVIKICVREEIVYLMSLSLTLTLSLGVCVFATICGI